MDTHLSIYLFGSYAFQRLLDKHLFLRKRPSHIKNVDWVELRTVFTNRPHDYKSFPPSFISLLPSSFSPSLLDPLPPPSFRSPIPLPLLLPPSLFLALSTDYPQHLKAAISPSLSYSSNLLSPFPSLL